MTTLTLDADGSMMTFGVPRSIEKATVPEPVFRFTVVLEVYGQHTEQDAAQFLRAALHIDGIVRRSMTLASGE